MCGKCLVLAQKKAMSKTKDVVFKAMLGGRLVDCKKILKKKRSVLFLAFFSVLVVES